MIKFKDFLIEAEIKHYTKDLSKLTINQLYNSIAHLPTKQIISISIYAAKLVLPLVPDPYQEDTKFILDCLQKHLDGEMTYDLDKLFNSIPDVYNGVLGIFRNLGNQAYTPIADSFWARTAIYGILQIENPEIKQKLTKYLHSMLSSRRNNFNIKDFDLCNKKWDEQDVIYVISYLQDDMNVNIIQKTKDGFRLNLLPTRHSDVTGATYQEIITKVSQDQDLINKLKLWVCPMGKADN